MEKLIGVENIYTEDVTLAHHIDQALKAWTLYNRDKEYVVKDGEIIIVDQFTGRLMQGRRFSQGLHQAIEAKEHVDIQRESRTLATITIQNYFRMYRKLSGMTGTAETEEEEFRKIYGLDVIVVPTNRPITREDKGDVIYKTEKAKYRAVAKEVKRLQEKGQPVLVGTISIERNEFLSALFEKHGIKYSILNAKQHEREAEIIAQAGQESSVTIATNMAGRGVDIVLGGAPFNKERYDKVIALGGLFVIATERHESRRIDNQLRGRSGRQGDIGSSQFFISLEDDLMRVFGSERLKSVMGRMGLQEDMPIQNKFISKSIESAQKRVEGHNFDIRKHLVEYDDVINIQRETMYRRRKEILHALESDTPDAVKNEVFSMARDTVNAIIAFHSQEEDDSKWNKSEIKEGFETIFQIPKESLSFLDNLSEVIKSERKKFVIDKLNELVVNQHYAVAEHVGGDGQAEQIERAMLLRVFDMLWMDHIDAIDQIRTGIGFQGYGNRDPLVEYKREAFHAFQGLLSAIREKALASIFRLSSVEIKQTSGGVIGEAGQRRQALTTLTYRGAAKTSDRAEDRNTAPVKEKPRDEQGIKVGRNSPCPCASGKKYKKCCGG